MHWHRLVLIVAGILGMAPVALAANDGGGEGPFRGTLDVSIWTLLVFLGLLAILRLKAWGPIQEALAERERKNLEAAEAGRKAREEAEALRSSLKAEQEASARKVAETLDEGRRDAQRVVEEMKAQAQAEIAAERERLKREVSIARDQALQEIWQKAASLATQVSGRILPRELNDGDQRRLIELAMNDLQGQGEELRNLLKSREL